MGFFDFLKPKPKPAVPPGPANPARPECDISKTYELAELFKTPPEQRDDAWQASFFATIPTASFACGNPQVFVGPDGFPYFVLRTPEENQPFESFCIQNMKDDFLLENGYGVVINPKENLADWVFSYGNILNLHLYNRIYSNAGPPDWNDPATTGTKEEILLAQPSESYLPKKTRELLKKFLQSIGLKRPKTMLICRGNGNEMIQALAFNIFAEDFSNTEDLNFRLQQISWFLPNHYVILSIPKKSELTKNFADL